MPVDLMPQVKSQLLVASAIVALLFLTLAELYSIRAAAALALLTLAACLRRGASRELQAGRSRIEDLQRQLQGKEEERLVISAALDAISEPVIGLDGRDHVTVWNRAATDLLGWSDAEARGRSVTQLVAAPAQRACLERTLDDMRTMVALVSRSCSAEALFRSKYDDSLQVVLTLAPCLGRGMTLLFRGVAGAPSKPEQRPELAPSHLQHFADNVPILIAYIDDRERLQYANATFFRWLRIDPATVHGKPFREVIGPDRYAVNGPYIQRALRGEQVVFEIDASAQIGRHLRNELIPHRRPDGSVAGLYSLTTDVTSMKEQERFLSELSRTDALTGLPNRRDGTQRLAEAIARTEESGLAMALMYLDIDHFKFINDTYGHATGDEVLRHFARRLRLSVRSTDMVARLAGDEFIVVLEGLHNSSEPQEVARKILGQVSAPLMVCGQEVLLGISIGIAMCKSGHLSVSEFLDEADQALYAAKENGRARFEMFERQTVNPGSHARA